MPGNSPRQTRYDQQQDSNPNRYSKRGDVADHERIRTILHHIHQNSIDKKNQTALDVYTYLRAEVERHVSTFGCEMSKHIQLSETTINAVEMR